MAFQVELACPFCAGVFPAEATAESRPTACPHCARTVTVPAAPIQPVPPAPPTPAEPKPLPEPEPKPNSPFEVVEPTRILVNRRGEAVPLRRLSPAERDRYRRRLNFAFALIGLAILTLALVVLLRFRP
jgi:hypothetical protein